MHVYCENLLKITEFVLRNLSNNRFYDKNAKLIIRACIFKQYETVKYVKKFSKNVEVWMNVQCSFDKIYKLKCLIALQ